MKNRKYIKNKKNGGNIPPVKDKRCLTIEIPCGNCIECMRKKAREWQVRLLEHIKENKNGIFITLTFSNEEIMKLDKKTKYQYEGYQRDNKIAKYAIRHWLERWRKKHKKSLNHWLITELGHEGTENIHLHGIVWTDIKNAREEIEKTWKYGFVWTGRKYDNTIENYISARTVTYITKYITKTDLKHKNYKPKILTSAGIGKRYIHTIDANNNKYIRDKTIETYRTETGHKIALPTYYKNKIYTEEEREKLWIEKMNKNEKYILGKKIKEKDYHQMIKHTRTINEKLGYGTDQKNILEEAAEHNERNDKFKERQKKAEEKARRMAV